MHEMYVNPFGWGWNPGYTRDSRSLYPLRHRGTQFFYKLL